MGWVALGQGCTTHWHIAPGSVVMSERGVYLSFVRDRLSISIVTLEFSDRVSGDQALPRIGTDQQ